MTVSKCESTATVAISPDDYTGSEKPAGFDAASPRWIAFLQAAGCKTRLVDVRKAGIIDELKGCDGFMWRWAHFAGMARIARRLLPVIEREMGIALYPDQATCWHYDDKIAQALLFEACELPAPKTWVFYDRDTAVHWLRRQKFPLVMKLATGAGSTNVALLESMEEAVFLIETIFGDYVQSLEPKARLGVRARASALLRQVVQGRPALQRDTGYDPQTGYALFQEFLAGNAYDTRITVIGHRAFGFRRFNRPSDFRASGSGLIDYSVGGIDERFVRLAFQAARRLRMQSCAIDGLWKDGSPVIGEVSYTYVSGSVHDCPGHWVLEGQPENGSLRWVEGQMWPEQAQVEDFLFRLGARQN